MRRPAATLSKVDVLCAGKKPNFFHVASLRCVVQLSRYYVNV